TDSALGQVGSLGCRPAGCRVVPCATAAAHIGRDAAAMRGFQHEHGSAGVDAVVSSARELAPLVKVALGAGVGLAVGCGGNRGVRIMAFVAADLLEAVVSDVVAGECPVLCLNARAVAGVAGRDDVRGN